MCRAHFDKNFASKVDKSLQKEIQAAAGAAYEERKAALTKAGEWVEN